MTSWIVLIFGLLGAWHYTDLHSDSALQNIVYPILFAVFLIVLLIKLVLLFGPESGRGGGGFGGSGGFSGGDGSCGGDGGSC